MHKLLLLFVSISFLFVAVAQSEDDYYDDNHIRYDDYTYNQQYKSVQFFKTGFELSKPIIQLGSGENLTLRFDDLYAGSQTYYYTFILCNADWTPADLLSMEYIDGVNEEYFNTVHGSFNTTIQYTNYNVQLPSRNMRLTKAGNYILKVFPEGEPDAPIITRRMYVVDNKVGAAIEFLIPNAPQYRDNKQELYVKVDLLGYSMPNIYEDFTMVIQQNGRKDNKIIKHVPKVMTSNYLYFNLANDILFDGSNEFRPFDIRSLRTQSARISTITFDSAGYQVDLLTDQSRNGKNYLNYSELNGAFSIINWDDPQLSQQIESDYAFVNFSLRLDSVINDGGIYFSSPYHKFEGSYKSPALANIHVGNQR